MSRCKLLFTLLVFLLLSFAGASAIQAQTDETAELKNKAAELLKQTKYTEALPILDRRTRERAALLIISDGADTASNATLRDVRSALLRNDVFVYAIAIDSADAKAINARVNVDALRDITNQSGGRTEVVRNSADLADATARIADELNSQYLIGYTSPKGADGAYHSIRVRVAGTDYRVRARNGYVATRE